MGLFILRLAEDGPAIKDGRIHVSRLLSAILFRSGNCNPVSTLETFENS